MRRWWRRLQRADRRVVDRWIAAAFVVAGEIELLFSDASRELALPAFVAYSALAWRRTRPVIAGVVMFATWILSNLLIADLKPLQVPLIAVLVLCYAMGAHTDGRAALAAPLVILTGMLGVIATFDEQVFTDYIFPTAFTLVAWLAGRGLRTRARLTEELHEASARAHEAHEAELARAAADERRRIAREMHDVVAHSVWSCRRAARAASSSAIRDGRSRRRRTSRTWAAQRSPRCGGCSG
jgi:signal transduction histidine kinase